ncbi:MAG: DUF3160 domain-containing protein [Lachnospiraceae bacterium]|nr:DUF3160 domain-containing protein [Lachnospiraceae bacterium]
MKKKRIAAILLCAAVALSACTKAGSGDDRGSIREDKKDTKEKDDEDDKPGDTDEGKSGKVSVQSGSELGAKAMARRPQFMGTEEIKYYQEGLKAQVNCSAVADDFSNVVYDENFAYLFTGEYNPESRLREALIENQFAVVSTWGNDEFYEIYEDNRYVYFPSFITVDSLMHSYHLYFAYLLRQTEKDYEAAALEKLSKAMLKASAKQLDELAGTEWEEAARINTAFFYVGAKLQDASVKEPSGDSGVAELADTEYQRIMDAKGIVDCTLNGLYEDYTQYKPRGYYAGDATLEAYFRAMMWYGRIGFEGNKETGVRCSALMCSALAEADLADWEGIYNVTSFFAGASDDPGYYEMTCLFDESYGGVPTTQMLKDDKDAFASLSAMMEQLQLPAINSIPVDDGDDPVIPTYRFMGQRFSIDAAIMQKLVYEAVKENSSGERRMLPDTLDVAAALGSDVARELLEEQGAMEYKNYPENLAQAEEHYNNASVSLWNASLYSNWLYTLRPLLEEKTDAGYPEFMKSEVWRKKELETFAGSFAELKHDNILYSKQVIAEMGGGEDDHIPDDRGYVDPQPVIYSRFAHLAKKTKDGLKNYGMISDASAEDLDRIYEIALRLIDISEKELQDKSLSDEDYDFIRSYGGDLEHFWYEANKDTVENLHRADEAPCPIIVDIATDPNGSVLEIGTGKAECMYVVFPIDGELHVGRGSVYSFYQFEQPMIDRLTDEEWRDILKGGHYDDDFNWVKSERDKPEQPGWTQDYRIPY